MSIDNETITTANNLLHERISVSKERPFLQQVRELFMTKGIAKDYSKSIDEILREDYRLNESTANGERLYIVLEGDGAGLKKLNTFRAQNEFRLVDAKALLQKFLVEAKKSVDEVRLPQVQHAEKGKWEYKGVITDFDAGVISSSTKSSRFNQTAMFFLWKFLAKSFTDGHKANKREIDDYIQKNTGKVTRVNVALESLLQKLSLITGKERKKVHDWFAETSEELFLKN